MGWHHDAMEVPATAFACAAFLAMAVLAALRGRREPLASRFANLCVWLFAYNSFEIISLLSPNAAWNDSNAASAALVPPAFFHFVMTFVGQRRARRREIIAYYVYFTALALACFSPAITPAMAGFPNGPRWAVLMLAGMAPCVAVGVVALVRHARRSGAEERARTALVLAAVVVAACGTATDLAAIAGALSPRLGPWALVGSAALLGVTALRTPVLEQVSVLVGLNAVAAAGGVVLGELALFRWVGDRSALLAVGSVLIGLAALLMGRFLLSAVSESRARLRSQAALGRMSQQMAHDLRNPLAAIRGAAQFLQVEREAGRPLEAHPEYLQLLVDQVDHMSRVIEQYQRLGRVDPSPRATDLNAIVEGALASVDCPVRKHLDATLPACKADPDLVAIVVENVLRNAREALGPEGSVEVTTSSSGGVVRIVVSDDGRGMDARTRERAFDEFFTTKAKGSGLGLAFVKRVMEAHEGRILLDSTEGKGTRVTLELPSA